MMKKRTALALSLSVLAVFFLFLHFSSVSFRSKAISPSYSYEEPDARISINTADAELLKTLPGIGSVLSEAIVEWRTEHGDFQAEEDLMQVPGIGEKTMEGLHGWITLEGSDENTDR